MNTNLNINTAGYSACTIITSKLKNTYCFCFVVKWIWSCPSPLSISIILFLLKTLKITNKLTIYLLNFSTNFDLKGNFLSNVYSKSCIQMVEKHVWFDSSSSKKYKIYHMDFDSRTYYCANQSKCSYNFVSKFPVNRNT